ncbi:L-proline cis-4-hydroxylase [soil metagenome]
MLNSIVEQVSAPEMQLDSIWSEPYPEYGSDGLKIATLLNHTGEQQNFDYHDCAKPSATPLLQKLTELHKFLNETGFHIMGSRLLRLDPGTFLHEHRDFVYLENVPRYRLHMPLITNDQAFITSPGLNVHFKKGYLWKLDPKQTIHSACNFGDKPRIHLMLDCYVEEKLQALLDQQFLDQDALHKLPALNKDTREQLLGQAQVAFNYGDLKGAEEILLASFCKYDLFALENGLTTYDLLTQFFERQSRSKALEERQNYWQERLVEVYPERKVQQLASV